jgi:hypothetical protein
VNATGESKLTMKRATIEDSGDVETRCHLDVLPAAFMDVASRELGEERHGGGRSDRYMGIDTRRTGRSLCSHFVQDLASSVE